MRSVVATPRDAAAEETVARFETEPAPLLPILHALQERDGFLREAALAVVADRLKIEAADLWGTVTFYHFFRLSPPPPAELCGGPACRQALGPGGEEELRATLAARTGGAVGTMSCPGRCDRPTGVRIGDLFLEGCAGAGSSERASSPPAKGPVLLRNVGEAGQTTLAGARSRGAWQVAERNLPAETILSELEKSGLAGRGGAGFPSALKWKAVLEAPGEPKYVVVNADEGEPGTFKDRVILEHDPHLLLEGIAVAARAVGAKTALIYLRYEYPEAYRVLESAIAEATAAGLLDGLAVYLRRGAGAYICGEETSLLNSLEGKKPFPRDKPPFPVTHGFEQKPTLLTNVETLAAAVRVLELGAPAWQALGRGGKPGTKLYSVSGDVARPGNYELPLGTPVAELIAAAAGTLDGAAPLAFTLGGLAGGLLPGSEIGLALDFDAPKALGTMLGSGGIVVIGRGRCPVDFVRGTMEFFRDESCGKCFPCRIGSQRIVERLDRLAAGTLEPTGLDDLRDISRVMARTSACGLGVAAPAPLDGLLRHFPLEVEAHRAGRCAAGVCGARKPSPVAKRHAPPPAAGGHLLPVN